MPDYPTAPCPKCGRPLPASGVVTAGGIEAPVYQCDTCTESRNVMGAPFEAAVTFLIDQNGRAVHPADLEDE